MFIIQSCQEFFDLIDELFEFSGIIQAMFFSLFWKVITLRREREACKSLTDAN